jgi:TonB-dependent receptor
MNNSHNQFKSCALALSISSVLAMSAGYAQAQQAEKTQAEDAQIEKILVRGVKGSQVASISTKRNSDQVVDSIVAEDIGKLPDTTIADSLQRINGVQIRRSAGEGSTVNVRGMPQVATLLNGEQFLSAGSITTVQPDFTDIPSSLISGVDVLKSPTASTLAGGISGTINLKSHRPFDLEQGWTLVGATEGTYGSYTEEVDDKTSMFAGYNADKWGAAFSATYSNSNLANYRNGAQNDGWWGLAGESWAWPQGAADVNADGDTTDTFFSFQSHSAMNRFVERERLGLTTSFQYELSSTLTLTADVFYTDMDQFDRASGIVAHNAWQNWGWFKPDAATEVAPGFYAVESVDLEARGLNAYSRSEVDYRESLNTNLQLDYDNGDRFKGSVRYLHGKATAERTKNFADSYLNDGLSQVGADADFGNGSVAVNPGGIKGLPITQANGQPLLGSNGLPLYYYIPVSIDYRGEHPDWNIGVDTGNMANYGLVSTYSEHNSDDEANLDILRADGSYAFELENITSVDFGVRYAKRDVTRFTYDLVSPFTSSAGKTVYAKWKDPASSLPDTGLSIAALQPFSGLPAGWVKQISDFGPVTGLPSAGLYFIDPKVMDDALGFQNALYGGNVRQKNPADSYDVEEKTSTVYTQANFEGDISALDLPFRGNLGVQVIKTQLNVLQNILGATSVVTVDGVDYEGISGTPLSDAGDVITDRDYTDVLPSFNISFDLTEELKLRAAYAKTMTALNTDDLGLGLSVTRTIDPNNSSLFLAQQAQSNGNPMMDPWRSDNFDISLEWYFNSSGLLSLGAFRMDIESFIETGTVLRSDIPDSDGVVRNTAVPTQTKQNGKGGTIDGIEFGYQQAFDFLPDFWSGFGVTFNYTYAPSESASKDYYGETLPISDNSEHSANSIIWYEKDGFQARIAHNYRSKRLQYPVNVWGQADFGFWQQPTAYVDASVSYDITDNFTVFAQGTNLTEEYEESYLQWESLKINQNIYERRYTLGLRARF